MIKSALCIVFSCVVFFKTQSQSPHSIKYTSENELWQETVGTLLKEPLWSTRDAYDAGHVLMIPMHYAFEVKDDNAIKQFQALFNRFSVNELPFGQLNQAQFIYLASSFLALKKKHKLELNNSNDSFIFKRILNFIEIKWHYDAAFQWNRKPFFGLKSRLDFILDLAENEKPRYYRSTTDFPLFIFAIAADLKYVSNHFDSSPPKKTMLESINQYTLKILKSRGEFTNDGGWLYQKGIKSDHRDFKYSGHTNIAANLKPKTKKDIAEDSSHSHRWPLWLRSFHNANLDNEEEKIYINTIFSALSYQFNTVVVDKQNKLPLLNNFMDGYNGIYRYNYNTLGENEFLGYGPYELSGVLGLAWYCFLNNSSAFYLKYKNSYPLSSEQLEIYVGPNTKRDRHPLFAWPDFFSDGFSELIANQAYAISKKEY